MVPESSFSKRSTHRNGHVFPCPEGMNTAQDVFCSSEFSITHGGANDIKVHVQSKKHQFAVASSKCAGDITFYNVVEYQIVVNVASRGKILISQAKY